MTSTKTRTFATLSAALLVGAGGGAGASLALGGDSGATRVVSTPGTAAAVTRPAADTTSSALSVNAIYRQTKQGVVDIKVTTARGRAEGSGFVADGQGDIVTNNHVVDGASAIEVQFAGGTRASARVVGTDPSSDLAVIRVSGVDASKLTPLTLGDSSRAQVGNGVVAIGSPYGLPGTVTVGVISALDRSIDAPNRYTISGAIQTDAPINHGNSGGPLLDSSGQVIGVNAQIESGSGDNSGVGFAIPSNTVKRVVEQIISGGQAQHAFLGVSLADPDTGSGATVAAVTSGSPAADAGISKGDLVVGVDGKPVTGPDDVIAAVQAHDPGDSVSLSVRPAGGDSARTVQVTLADRSA